MQVAGTNSCRISLKAMLTVMILKKENESIFFQNNRLTACNVKDEKDVTNSLMVFNLLKIVHSFRCKKI